MPPFPEVQAMAKIFGIPFFEKAPTKLAWAALSAGVGLYFAFLYYQPRGSFQEVWRNDSKNSYILVFAYPSSAYLDWSSPTTLSRTSLQSSINKRVWGRPSAIGHAQFAWRCQRPDGAWEMGASGQSGERSGQALKALLGGWGLSVLELVFTDGHLEDLADVEQRVRIGVKTGQFSWLGLKVPAQNCLNLANYVKEYRTAKAFRNYGFPLDPLKLQGGGCTSYANAALQRSGLDLPFRPAWVRHYEIAEKHLGRSQAPPSFSTILPQSRVPKSVKKVSLTSFLFGSQSWAQTGEKSIPFAYYDPELFYEGLRHMENSLRKEQQLSLKKVVRTRHLDLFQRRIQNSSESWMRLLKIAEKPMHIQELMGVSGAVIDLQ
jgi:hypothetical protein